MLRLIIGRLAIVAVLSGLGCFVYYALNVYKPTGHVSCGSSVLARQTDVAIHVVRQWFGHEGQLYTPCPGGSA